MSGRAFAPRIATACALLALLALALAAVLRAPPAHLPARIGVALPPGASIVLGRAELASPQAAAAQLAVRRDASGRWLLGSAGQGALSLGRGGEDSPSASTPLAPGDRFQLGATSFKVEASDESGLRFADGRSTWHFDGRLLRRDGSALPPCPQPGLAARLAAGWNRVAPRLLSGASPVQLGGNLRCGNRLGIPGVPAGAASLLTDAQGRPSLALTAGAGGAPVLVFASTGVIELARREHDAQDLDSILLGRTRLHVEVAGERLLLRPAGRVALFSEPRAELPPAVQWEWRQRQSWHAPPPLLWSLGLGLAGLCLAAVYGHASRRPGAPAHLVRIGACLLLALLGLVAMVLQRTGTPPGVGVSLLLVAAALGLSLLFARGGPALAGVLLLGSGALVQLELGLGAPDTSWLRHFQKTAALMALGLGAWPLLLDFLRRPLPPLQSRVEGWMLLLAGAALAALLLQVAFGDETGVFDMQPVEFAKLALAVLTAHCLALGLGASGERGGVLRHALRVLAPVLLFILLLGVALVQVDDYSPLILLFVWASGMALAWSLATRRLLPAAALALCACIAVAGIGALRGGAGPESGQWDFYGERFAVWLDPAAHPHTGQQLLLAGRAIAAGGWLGVDGLLGLASLGDAAGAALRVPAVQDDFAPAFLLNRHGLAAGLLLWLLQAAFIATLLVAAARDCGAANAARDFRQAWLCRFRCFLLCGGAAFVCGHLLLSWGTNLALFPVMGQPMSFLSAGGSHLLFFICPLLAAGSASAQT